MYRAFQPLNVFILVAAFLFSQIHASAYGAPQLFTIAGWPFIGALNESHPPQEWIDDAILGRLVCPSLARLNLKTQKTEPLILKSITQNVISDGGITRTIWTLTLRSGIRFWSGDDVTATHISDYLIAMLAAPSEVHSSTRHPLTSQILTISVLDRSNAIVSWPAKDSPQELFKLQAALQKPFWRSSTNKSSPLAFECAGRFKPSRSDQLALPPTSDSAQNSGHAFFVESTQTTSHASKIAFASPGSKASLTFTFANQAKATPDERAPSEPMPCQAWIDLPYTTAILWNMTESSLASDPKKRIALTKAIPRGELLRAGSAHAGVLATAIIPPFHPGYDPSLTLRSTSHAEAAEELATLKSSRPLTLLAPTTLSPLLKKVITDSLNLLKLQVTWEDLDTTKPYAAKSLKNPTASSRPWDGFVDTFHVPWSLPNGHSFMLATLCALAPERSLLCQGDIDLFSEPSVMQFWGQNKPLAQAYFDYHHSLIQSWPSLDTQGRKMPAVTFSSLQKAHKLMYEWEPLSVVMHHRACLGGPALPKGFKAQALDPDWFINLLTSTMR